MESMTASHADTDARADLMSYLDFHVEAGVDAALDERPHDRFTEAEAAAQAPAPRAEPAPRREPLPREPLPHEPLPREPLPQRDPAPGEDAPLEFRRELPSRDPPPREPPRTYGNAAGAKPGEAADDARARAAQMTTLEELEALLRGFEGCGLRFTAKNLVFADGNPQARVMFVGEAPGADEDRIGKPFMGRSGQLLDRMMAAIGLDRSSAYISNVVPWRPPGNRNPTPQEISICRPFVERQIELANPDILVCLGAPATQTLTGTKDGILKARGRFYPYRLGDGREIRALATLHPAYLLRQPVQKRLAWRDFRMLKSALDGSAPAK
ncbi:MAG TPA: uracil-DNA glycosylase [Methylobacterium sp.]|jgi:DNA polymerase|uniref:uracil-DNA glycosylase n=1 Tax=Methylorubrum sp. B1-46 TaxID=2897334 RepID=UPI001E45C11A|nr:uracil-DNA glycosylase [Methylorubrum sp. B1-46]UGB25475.1 uracil-DNA glycosylase [Methylorubrum sp. B1-46]HEV2544883.1 uracil-DNA glycosylase [Methylobacterium sp.]